MTSMWGSFLSLPFLQPRLHRWIDHQLQRAVSRSEPVKCLWGEWRQRKTTVPQFPLRTYELYVKQWLMLHVSAFVCCFHDSAPAAAGGWRQFVLSARTSHSRKWDILRMPWGNFLKIGTNIHLDSRMNWLDFGGHRSKVQIHMAPKAIFLPCEHYISGMPSRNPFPFGTSIHWTWIWF